MTGIRKNIKKIIQRFKILKYPKKIYIVLNGRCNLKCKMCDIGQKNIDAKFYRTMKSDVELSLGILENIAKEIEGQPVGVHFNGTEPLLFKNIDKIITMFTSRNISCTLTTNGFLLPFKAEAILSSGLHELCVSIDGPEKTHDIIRGVNGSYKKAINGINFLLANRNQYPKIRVAIAVSNYNYLNLMETINIMKNLGIDKVTVSHLNFVTNDMASIHNKEFEEYFGPVEFSSISSVNPSEINTKKLIKSINGIKMKYDDYVNFIPEIYGEEIEKYYHSFNKFVYSDRCIVAWNSLQILSDGTVIPASRCFNIKMGSIYHNSIKDIWKGPKFKEFRKNITKFKATPACARCCALFANRTIPPYTP